MPNLRERLLRTNACSLLGRAISVHFKFSPQHFAVVTSLHAVVPPDRNSHPLICKPSYMKHPSKENAPNKPNDTKQVNQSVAYRSKREPRHHTKERFAPIFGGGRLTSCRLLSRLWRRFWRRLCRRLRGWLRCGSGDWSIDRGGSSA